MTHATANNVYARPGIIKDDDSLIQFMYYNLDFLWFSLDDASTDITSVAIVLTLELSKDTQSKIAVSSKRQRKRSVECIPKKNNLKSSDRD